MSRLSGDCFRVGSAFKENEERFVPVRAIRFAKLVKPSGWGWKWAENGTNRKVFSNLHLLRGVCEDREVTEFCAFLVVGSQAVVRIGKRGNAVAEKRRWVRGHPLSIVARAFMFSCLFLLMEG
jgi:hypothetical protein